MCTADNIYQEFIIEDSEFDKYTDMWFKRVEQYYLQFILSTGKISRKTLLTPRNMTNCAWALGSSGCSSN